MTLAGFAPDSIIKPDVPEEIIKGEKPRAMALRLTLSKMQKALQIVKEIKEDNCVLVVGDTVSAIGTKIIDKTVTDDQVREAVNEFSGRKHTTYSGVCVVLIKDGEVVKSAQHVDSAKIKMAKIPKPHIDHYVNIKAGIGMSGGMCLESFAGSFVQKFIGDPFVVQGLSARRITNAMHSFGISPKSGN